MGKYVLLPDENAPKKDGGKYELLPPGEPDRKDLRGSVMVDRSPESAAGAGTIAGASFVDSPTMRIAYYAKRRFPNLSPEEAFARYTLMPDGAIVYKKDDGSYAAEVPAGWSPGAMFKRAAQGTGAAVSAAPAMATGIATAPMMVTGPAGIAGSIAATGAAGAGGEAIRQGIGKLIADDPISGGDIAKEAAWSAGGQGLGEAITYGIGRRLAADISKYDPAAASQMMQKGARMGVDLTLPEASNMPSLKFRQQVVSEMPGGASDTMEAFYQKRAGQTDTAMSRFLDTLTANDSIELAGQRAKGAANEAIEQAVKKRAQAAGPVYQAAFAQTPGINPAAVPRAKALMDRMPAAAVNEAMEIARIEGINLGDPRASLKGMHYLKMGLDKMLNNGPWEGVTGVKKQKIAELKAELVSAMDDISAKDSQGRSLYKLAREIYAGNSPAVEIAKDPGMSLVGLVSGLSDRRATEAAKMVLDPKRSGPLAMSQFKRAVTAVDPEAWQQVKRAYLQDLWAEAGQRFATGQPYLQPAKFAAAMMSPKQRQMLQEALSPPEMAAFNDLMEVFEATGRGLPRNSTTVPKALEARRMEREAGGLPALALRAGQLTAPSRWAGWVEEARLGKHAEKIADIITDPNAQQLLKQLKQVSPNEARFSALLGQLLTRGVRDTPEMLQ